VARPGAGGVEAGRGPGRAHLGAPLSSHARAGDGPVRRADNETESGDLMVATTQRIESSALGEVAALGRDVIAEVGRAFLGDAEPVELILTATLARGHVLLEGVPGVAKTTLVKALASALGCSFRRVQFTPDLLPSDITGTYV